MTKGVGRFLGRGRFHVSNGGDDLFKYKVSPGNLVTSKELPDNGIYEVEEVYNFRDAGTYGPIQVRRVDMRYLTKKQRESVVDISLKPSEEIQRFEKKLEKILAIT